MIPTAPTVLQGIIGNYFSHRKFRSPSKVTAIGHATSTRGWPTSLIMLLRLLRENTPHLAVAAPTHICARGKEAGRFVGRYPKAAVAFDANAKLRRLLQWRPFLHEIQELRRGIDLIVERAVRELLEFVLIRLAPVRALGQPDLAALDHIDVMNKSRGLRAA